MKLYIRIVLFVALAFVISWFVHTYHFYARNFALEGGDEDVKYYYILARSAQEYEGMLLNESFWPSSFAVRGLDSINHWATDQGVSKLSRDSGEHEIWIARRDLNPYFIALKQKHLRLTADDQKELIQKAINVRLQLPNAVLQNEYLDQTIRFDLLSIASAIVEYLHAKDLLLIEGDTRLKILSAELKGISHLSLKPSANHRYVRYLLEALANAAFVIHKQKNEPMDCNSLQIKGYATIRFKLDEFWPVFIQRNISSEEGYKKDLILLSNSGIIKFAEKQVSENCNQKFSILAGE